jgi:hypothetical protein
MAMDADPEVMPYIGTGAIIPPDRDRAPRAVTRWRKQWDEQGHGMCSVIVAATGQPVAVHAITRQQAGLPGGAAT